MLEGRVRMSEEKKANLGNQIEELNTISYKAIPKEIIYPEFRKLLGKAFGLVLIELLLIYFIVFPVMLCFKSGHFSINVMWRFEKLLWSLDSQSIDFFITQMGLSMIGMFFGAFFIAFYLWNYCLFKYGIEPQLSKGQEITDVIVGLGMKMFKWFLLSILVLSILSGVIWVTFIPAALGISIFIFAFVVNIYFNMELTRLGVPALANKIIEVLEGYKKRY